LAGVRRSYDVFNAFLEGQAKPWRVGRSCRVPSHFERIEIEMKRYALPALFLLCVILPVMHAQQVSYERLLRAAGEPQNWLTYSGTYASQRYSVLGQITPANVKNLEQ